MVLSAVSSRRAHPRSRGENGGRVAGLRGVRGSSPLTRGKRGWRATDVVARVAHPRSRGENSRLLSAQLSGSGSSPLTRGKRSEVWGGTEIRGLIPAHAGKTSGARSGLIRAKAHPRSRGENWKTWPVSRSRKGSSPLTRGKRFHDRCRRDAYWLIPAHAGKTQTAPSPA